MRNIFTSRRLWLEPGEVASLRATRPLRLQIACGRVWVTLEGRSADYWLCGGQSMDITGQGLVVIEGVSGSSKLEVRTRRREWVTRAAGAVNSVVRRLRNHREAAMIETQANCNG